MSNEPKLEAIQMAVARGIGRTPGERRRRAYFPPGHARVLRSARRRAWCSPRARFCRGSIVGATSISGVPDVGRCGSPASASWRPVLGDAEPHHPQEFAPPAADHRPSSRWASRSSRWRIMPRAAGERAPRCRRRLIVDDLPAIRSTRCTVVGVGIYRDWRPRLASWSSG